MIRPIMRDVTFLAKPSVPATPADKQIAIDLLETLKAHKEDCVGMAGNMIGIRRRMIAFLAGAEYMLMLNPIILKAEGPYETEEGCLSLLDGPRKTKRYRKIKVQYQTTDFQTRIKTFEGYTAQIIQHEVDHCNGVLI